MNTKTSFEHDVLKLEMVYLKRISYAFQCNAIPVINGIVLHNHSSNDLTQIHVTIESDPVFAEPVSMMVNHIPVGGSYHIDAVRLLLKSRYLADLQEREAGHLTVCCTMAGSEILRQAFPVELQAFNEWCGLSALPEILAAFVTPNLPVIESIIGQTSDLLKKQTGKSAIDGYQSNSPRRVLEMMAALYDAVRAYDIRYINPPAGFEQTGQKIRFANRIIRQRFGTCLDLSLLFASCLEQMGLHPLVLLQEGHAYAGCWLVEESFPDACIDDLQAIRKRVDPLVSAIAVFEPTLLTSDAKAPFSHSEQKAISFMAQEDVFKFALDVHQARTNRILPLPLMGTGDDVVIDTTSQPAEQQLPAASVVAEDRFSAALQIPEQEAALTRIDRWCSKLLDLSLRNRLLNFRETRQTAQLLCPHPELLEDMIAADTTFTLHPKPSLMDESDPRDSQLHQDQMGEDALTAHLTKEMQQHRMYANLPEVDLRKRLTQIYRNARLAIEEGGANTLYLAMGMLEWRENPESERVYQAPILLVPVSVERKSVIEGFSIRRLDEDTVVNVTLLEFLKRNFQKEVPGLNPPPEDESGVDVGAVMKIMQQAILDLKGWEVRQDVWLGHFSFTKYLMWKDLNDRSESLTQNKVVNHLVHHVGEDFPSDSDWIDATELDAYVSPDELFCPKSIDSSQLTSVIAAASGKSFILKGPPGTGKSQTISNMIAHCMAVGKSVLFVAEKRAALDVVYRRLSDVGLQPFCLELHSNKIGKRSVLAQFAQAMDFQAKGEPACWEALTEALEDTRTKLNALVKLLHKQGRNGLSAFTCFSALLGACDRQWVDLTFSAIADHDAKYLDMLNECVESLVLQASKYPDCPSQPLASVYHKEWTPQWETRAAEVLNKVLPAIKQLEPALTACAAQLKVALPLKHYNVLDAFVLYADHLSNIPAQVPSVLLQSTHFSTDKSQIETALAWIDKRNVERQKLNEYVIERVMTANAAELQARWDAARKSWFLPRYFKSRALCKEVGAFRNDGKSLSPTQVSTWLTSALRLQEFTREVVSCEHDVIPLLDILWRKGEPNTTVVRAVLDWVQQWHDLMIQMADGDMELLMTMRETGIKVVAYGQDVLKKSMPIGQCIEVLTRAYAELNEALASVVDVIDLKLDAVRAAPDYLQAVEHLVSGLLQNRDDWRDWCRLRQVCAQAVEYELGPLVDAYLSAVLSHDDLQWNFEIGYRKAYLNLLLEQYPMLRDFFGDDQQRQIERFRKLDQVYIQLTRDVVTARLAARMPSARNHDVAKTSEIGVLKREISKKRRNKPVRQLLKEIANLLPRLKPCLLMSPLSVAQYLEASSDHFDVIIFDEASQIPVWDAVGAIARGKQLVVVGDPKQLPPTSFFSRSDDDEDSEDDLVEDLESILDECIAARVPLLDLRWHYRSRHESLIAFSNYHYYDNRLFTFPAPDQTNLGVSFHHVPNGFYDKGRTRTNKQEADAVVAEVLRRLQDPVLSKYTIGVVTFSQAQQTLIENLLDEMRAAHPEVEPFFSDDLFEPVFVKNLENVQGDERDVIIFSIGYGPDKQGHVSMNFGPLNRMGGERRLNVAITRSRREVHVFSTLRYDQIDLNRTRALGARHLKHFLEYAERGPAALSEARSELSTGKYGSDFVKYVAEKLRQQGWKVETQVGCSGYRIDLAVVDPENPDRYLLGIECDGPVYRDASTARDRDKLRQLVLGYLGWHMIRIWSADWYWHPERELKNLSAAIKQATDSADEPANKPDDPEHLLKELGVVFDQTPKPVSSTTVVQEKKYIPHLADESEKQDAFYTNDKKVIRHITRVINKEGPVSYDTLQKRIIDIWGFSRTGSRISERIHSLLPADVKKTSAGEVVFLWPEECDPATYNLYRSHEADDPCRRRLEDVATEELSNAMTAVLQDNFSLEETELYRLTARIFGWQQTPSTDSMSRAFAQLMAKGYAEKRDNLIVCLR